MSAIGIIRLATNIISLAVIVYFWMRIVRLDSALRHARKILIHPDVVQLKSADEMLEINRIEALLDAEVALGIRSRK